jgi:hypothetical protein
MLSADDQAETIAALTNQYASATPGLRAGPHDNASSVPKDASSAEAAPAAPAVLSKYSVTCILCVCGC